MSAANKIAQELTAIPQEFQDKAIEATLRSQFWEIIDCPVTLDLALAFAKQDGADPICRLRKCARALALKTQDPKACQYLLEIYESDKPEEELASFKNVPRPSCTEGGQGVHGGEQDRRRQKIPA